MKNYQIAQLHALAALLLGGCVTYKEEEFATIRSHRVPPAVYRKLKEREVATPSDLIVLTRCRVPDALIVKQIDKIGIDYILKRSEVTELQTAGVSPAVIESLTAASDRFVTRFAPPGYFETHDMYSDEYVTEPAVRYHGSLGLSSEFRRPRY